MARAKRVAIIGCGPAGAIAIDAFAQEQAFDKIRVFERREKPGGCWVPDPADHVQQLPDLLNLAERTADEPLEIPDRRPVWTARSARYRFSDTSIYPKLETNIAVEAMEFSQEPIPSQKSAWSMHWHGSDTPFRHHSVVQAYLEGLVDRKGYSKLVEYNTTVERVTKNGSDWTLVLRKEVNELDYWWDEDFDAVIDASGHLNIPYIPHIPGLAEFSQAYPGSVEHTKSFRSPENYRGKRVVTVGASISAPDAAASLAGIAENPLHCVVRGKYHPYFGDYAFRNPYIVRHPPISLVEISDRTIVFDDGTCLSDVDHIILGTGYSWTQHFLPSLQIRNNRVPGLYQHIFYVQDPTLCFIGGVAPGFTFKVFEWQAVLAARHLAGRVMLPSVEEQEKWERDRIAQKGDGVSFTTLYPDFEEYFEEIRRMAGEPMRTRDGLEIGRRLPKFDPEWRRNFDDAHLKRIAMWKKANSLAEEDLKSKERNSDRSNGKIEVT